MLNISDRAYVDLSLNSIDTESMALGEFHFIAYAMIGPRVWSDDSSFWIGNWNWRWMNFFVC